MEQEKIQSVSKQKNKPRKFLVIAIIAFVLVIFFSLLLTFVFSTIQYKSFGRQSQKVPEGSKNIQPIRGDHKIQMEKTTFSQGEIMKATFPSTSQKDIYVEHICFGGLPGWKLFQKNSTGGWSPLTSWYSPAIWTCINSCENNSIVRIRGCDGLCQSPIWCEKLANYATKFEWNLRTHEIKEGICDDKQGKFIFVNHAPPGEYKLRFEYFEDSECSQPKYNEKEFAIAHTQLQKRRPTSFGEETSRRITKRVQKTDVGVIIIEPLYGDELRAYPNERGGIVKGEMLEQPAPSAPESSFSTAIPERWINPTAPNDLIKYLSGDFTDSDTDGMTDAAERKYGFDPSDAKSFPQEPKVQYPPIPIPDSGMGAEIERSQGRITIRWKDPEKGGYSLTLRNKNQEIYYGGHEDDNAAVSYEKFNLRGNEMLTGSFSEYNEAQNHVKDFPEFTIDLSQMAVSGFAIGDKANLMSYTFSDDFPKDAEKQYREFLKKVFPLLYAFLGPPAESFNAVFTYTEESDSFTTLDDGRTFLTDGDFIPRLITHEFIHAWQGAYGITRWYNGEYDDTLTAFEEATAEGMAFEIVHEYVRSYPNDSATLKLLESKPYQYWSYKTSQYDSIKHNRWTQATDFWTHAGGQRPRYSIVATTFQMLVRERPTFMRDFLERYYKTVRENPQWLPNRGDIIQLWQSLVPKLNGYELRAYLDTLPVFTAKKLKPGVYILNTIRPYGLQGDQQFAVGYAIEDGSLWWGVEKDQLSTIPAWIKTSKGEDSLHYIDVQKVPFTVDVVDASGKIYPRYRFATPWDRDADGSPSGLGWSEAKELAMEKFPVGLYKETVTFPDFLPHDKGARESFYFFGLKNFEQKEDSEYVLFIGIDGVSKGKATIQLNGENFTSPIKNGVAIFRSSAWPFDMQGKFSITVTRPDGVSRKYYRTIVESGTVHNYYQQQFIIVDANFNGTEDQFEFGKVRKQFDKK